MATARAAAEPAAQAVLQPQAGQTMSFEQVSAVLNQIVNQATGQSMPAAVNTSQFVTQADTAIKLLNNQLIPAISAVMTKTIFKERPYAASFKGLMRVDEQWGAIRRKLSPYDTESFDDGEYGLKDGDLAGTWKIKVPKVLQTVFIGGAAAERQLTFYRHQLDTGFRNADEFAQFVAMYVTNFKNCQEQEFESLARWTVNNGIGAVVQSGRPEQQIHLLTEYNQETGSSLTTTSVMSSDNYVAFVLWLVARLNTLFDMLAVRSVNYHVSPDIGNGLSIKRNTPRNFARMYTLSKWSRSVQNRVMPQLFDGSALQVVDSEVLPFWQSASRPDQIIVTPSTIDNAGHTITGTQQTLNNVFGVIMDVDAMGAGLINQWSAPTILDPHLGAWAEFYHFTRQYFNDLTENIVVLFMD